MFSHYNALFYTQILEGSFHHELMVKWSVQVKDTY